MTPRMWVRSPMLASQAENPLHALRLDGRAIKLRRNQEESAYAAAETLASMIPWNGDTEKMIDRFDGRALLDFYKEPDPRTQHQQSEAERELEEVLNYHQQPFLSVSMSYYA
jgi:arginine/serine-rich splicing factor 16